MAAVGAHTPWPPSGAVRSRGARGPGRTQGRVSQGSGGPRANAELTALSREAGNTRLQVNLLNFKCWRFQLNNTGYRAKPWCGPREEASTSDPLGSAHLPKPQGRSPCGTCVLFLNSLRPGGPRPSRSYCWWGDSPRKHQDHLEGTQESTTAAWEGPSGDQVSGEGEASPPESAADRGHPGTRRRPGPLLGKAWGQQGQCWNTDPVSPTSHDHGELTAGVSSEAPRRSRQNTGPRTK